MTKKTVLSVGQCHADGPWIARVLRTHFDADVIAAGNAEEGFAALRHRHIDLVLVNRVFDWDADSGLDFISQVKEDEALKQMPVMLVSNYDDAQQDAVGRGALPGFGKAALEHPKSLGLLRKVLGTAKKSEAGEPGA